MKTKFFLIFLLINFFVIFSFPQAKFTISPPYFEFMLKPKTEKTFLILANNSGDSTLHIKIYANDWDYDNKGNLIFFDSKTLNYSCSDWFYINPMEFNIPPHTEQEVRVTIHIPDNVFGEYRSILFFETTPFSPDPNSMIQFNSRLGCGIYTSIFGTVSLYGEMTNIEYDKNNSSIIISFKNSGNMHCRVSTNLKIYKNHKNIYEQNLSPQLVLPEHIKKIPIPIETYLEPGTYTIKVLMDYGGNEILEGEKTIIIN